MLPAALYFFLMGGAVLLTFAASEVVTGRLVSSMILGIAGLLFAGIGLVGVLQAEKRAEDRRKSEVKRELSDSSSSIEYFEKLVNINVENLSAYYVTVKNHANKSFLASLFVGLVGFVLIGIGIDLAIKDTQHGPSVALLSGLSGVATEFISAVFFYLYSRTVRQMKEYHDSLLSVQNVLLSFKLVGETSDPQEKAKMIEVMLEYLVGRRSAPEETGRTGSRHQAKRKASEPETQASAKTE